MQNIVRQLQAHNPDNCHRTLWNPTIDNTTAIHWCWRSNPATRRIQADAEAQAQADINTFMHFKIPTTLYSGPSDDDTVRLSTGRDAHNNIIIYWSNQEGQQPYGLDRCWLYSARTQEWDTLW